ncbi:MAG: DUF58 domain-containing protein [Bacteroidales bacterium]|nr:DUF58 domain-containing protein [Bacteroidales bacterium]
MKSTIEIQDFQQFNKLEFLAKQVVEGFITGLHKSPFHGFSVEFAEHRLYNKGEPTRHIDWKLYARTEKLFVKRYEEETNLRSQILIDTSSSMLFPYGKKFSQNKLSFSALISAALIYLLNKQRDAVGLTLFSDHIELHTEARLSSVHGKRLYAELGRLLNREEYALKKNTTISEVLHNIAEQIHKRSLIIIFSDMIAGTNVEDIFSALQHLRHNKHEVILFHVVDKSLELDFNFQNRPYKFVDLESGKSIKLNPNDVRELFRQQSSSAFEELKLKCAQYKIDFVEADIKGDFREVLVPYMLKRQKLH